MRYYFSVKFKNLEVIIKLRYLSPSLTHSSSLSHTMLLSLSLHIYLFLCLPKNKLKARQCVNIEHVTAK